jgi:hypothetical protein
MLYMSWFQNFSFETASFRIEQGEITSHINAGAIPFLGEEFIFL